MEIEQENEIIEEPPPPREEEALDQVDMSRPLAMQALNNLCNLVPFSELKKLRLVCPLWNDIVSRHPRFRSAHAHFKTDWNNSTKKLQFSLEAMTKWQYVTMRFFPIHRNTYFLPYWGQAGPFVKTLNLDSLRVGCMELCKIINMATALTSIKFNRIMFEATDLRIPENGEPEFFVDDAGNERERMPTTDNPIYKVHCNHENCNELYQGQGQEIIGAPTIRKIEISYMKTFPLCLLDLLRRRSQGILVDFSVFNLVEERDTTRKVYPTMVHMQPHIIRICQENRNTLRSLCWARNQLDPNLMDSLGEEIEGNNWNFEKLTLAMANLKQRWFVNHHPQPLFWGFISRQAPFLVELNLALHLTPDARHRLAVTFPLLVNLRKVKFQVDTLDREIARDVNFFRTCSFLTDLTIVDTSVKLTERDWWGNQELAGISMEHLAHLPMSIRKLICAHRMRSEPQVRAGLSHPNLHNLTMLVILDATTINDGTFQLIIRNLSLLQILKLMHGRVLTDAGVTGMTLMACKILHRCQKHELWLKEPKPETQTGVSIRELVHLRELDLNHCSKLTDVSLCHAFRFPELRKLTLNMCINMGGLGLSYVGLHNPKLQKLEVFGCPKICHVELNRLITVSKSLRNIVTGRCNLDPAPNARYVEHPSYKEIVTIYKYALRIPYEHRKNTQEPHIDEYVF